MAKFICLQSGHESRTTGATGAPGEIELNVRIRNRLSQILIDKGFMVQLVNADPNPEEINKDFNLFLACHGDANIYGTGGGCVASGDKTVDSSYVESARIRDAIASMYFDHSGIVNHPERINPNMTKYYMWAQLTKLTPCVIIEMGVVQDAHDKVLLADTERIASALARGICKAFAVAYEPSQPPVTPPAPEPPVIPPPPVQPPSTPIPEPSACQEKLKAIYNVLWGSGWMWSKYRKIKELLPK